MEARLDQPGRWLLQGGLRWQETAYRRLRGLTPVGPMLLIGTARHRGPVRQLADGTRIRPDDRLGELHFDNLGLAALGGEGRRHVFRFAQQLRRSLDELARRSLEDPAWAGLVAFRGVTWLPPHGARVGFEAYPLPPGLHSRALALHFRLLVYAFHPGRRVGVDGPPHEYWLSRRRLIEGFGPGGQYHGR